MPVEIIKVSASQIELLQREKAVFFFPVGSLEDHGPHLPLGIDLEEANRLCFMAADRLERELPGWTGVIMPRAPLGIDSNTTEFALTVRAHVLRDWLVDSSRALIRRGFFHFVCFSGNLGPRQLTAIEEAGKIVRKTGRWKHWAGFLIRQDSMRPALISANSAWIAWKDVIASPFWPDPKEHGGQRDTSVALAISKEWVDPGFAILPQLDRKSSRWKRNLDRRLGQLRSYWGNPAVAQAEVGEKELKNTLDRIFPKMRTVWEGANPEFLFRSWYSILPPNKSFYKAWLLLILICLFIAVWGYFNLFFIQIE